MREGLAELREDSWILWTVAVEYLEERRRKNLNRLGDWAREGRKVQKGGANVTMTVHRKNVIKGFLKT